MYRILPSMHTKFLPHTSHSESWKLSDRSSPKQVLTHHADQENIDQGRQTSKHKQLPTSAPQVELSSSKTARTGAICAAQGTWKESWICISFRRHRIRSGEHVVVWRRSFRVIHLTQNQAVSTWALIVDGHRNRTVG